MLFPTSTLVSIDLERVDDHTLDRCTRRFVVAADDLDHQSVAAWRQVGRSEESGLILLLQRRPRIDLGDERAIQRNSGDAGVEPALAEPADRGAGKRERGPRAGCRRQSRVLAAQ